MHTGCKVFSAVLIELRFHDRRQQGLCGPVPPRICSTGVTKFSRCNRSFHFHVPIFLERFGHLRTSQDDTLDCLRFLNHSDKIDFTGHLEVETYAWDVLPKSLVSLKLSEGIAREIEWLQSSIQKRERS